MSYARFGSGDVYVLRTFGKNPFMCCACRLEPKSSSTNDWFGDFLCRSQEEMIDHLLIHREAGHKVPKHAIDRLLLEIEVADPL